MRRAPFGAVTVALLCLAWLSASCAREAPTQVSARPDGVGPVLDQNGDVTVFAVPGDEQNVAVRFAKVMARDKVTGHTVLMAFAEAESKLEDSDPAILVSIWRMVPASRTYDRSLANEMPSAKEFKSLLGADGAATLAEDPPPPPGPSPGPGSCPCVCDCCSTFGCIKCCYKNPIADPE